MQRTVQLSASWRKYLAWFDGPVASIGLTVSDAFRLMMVRTAREKALPFGL